MLEAGRQRRGVILVGLDVRPGCGEHGFGAIGRGMPDDLRVNGQRDEVLDVAVFVVVDVTLGWGTKTECRVLVVDMTEKFWLRSELTPVRAVEQDVVGQQRDDLGTGVGLAVPRVTRERPGSRRPRCGGTTRPCRGASRDHRSDHAHHEQRGDHAEQRDERRQQQRLRHRRRERLAQELGQLRHRPAPAAGVCPPGISALIRDVMNAAMPALPSTEPT